MSYKRLQMLILVMALLLLAKRSLAIQCRAVLGEHCSHGSDEKCKACPACPLGSGWDITFRPRTVNKCGDIECFPCVNCRYGNYRLDTLTGSDFNRRRFRSQMCIPSQDEVQRKGVERPELPSPLNSEPSRKLFQGLMITGTVFIWIGFIGVFCHFKRKNTGTAEMLNLLRVDLNNSNENDTRKDVEHGLLNPNHDLNQDFDIMLTNAGFNSESQFFTALDVSATNSSDDMDDGYEIDASIGQTLPETIRDVHLSQTMTRGEY